MARFTGPLVKYPARATFAWFLGLILIGTLLLRLPLSTAEGRAQVSLLDAAFTATSAACVTGLTVRSTAQDYSLFGQAVIFVLFQMGGLGIMTVTTFFALEFGGRATLHQKAVLAQTLGTMEHDLRWVLMSVLRFVFALEVAGFLLLAGRNLWAADQPALEALWSALFHTVSAFCNAGFSLHDDSLVGYQGDVLVNFTVMGLIIVGGAGFPVILDLQRAWGRRPGEMWSLLTLHTKIMLLGTAGLLAFGTLVILVLESNHAFASMSWGRSLLVATFQATTPRTAGFQTIDLAHLHEATLFTIVVLMLIGGGACSTAGGFKVSTFMVLVCHAWSRFRGSQRVQLFRRAIPQETVGGAMAAALLFGVTAGGALTMLLMVEPSTRASFLDVLFEVASALGTVGLSVDVQPQVPAETGSVATFTPFLNPQGKLIIILLMFLGRLGPISVFVALSRGERKDRIEYPREAVLVG